MNVAHHSERVRAFRFSLALAALGVVFGDIGTSPLYAFRQCFFGILRIAPTHENVLGIISLILWSLILIVFVRYIGMIMRVTHDGEGGILALLAFVLPPVKRGVPPPATWLTFLVILGAGMLFGDGIITPAVSVLSSVEGLALLNHHGQKFRRARGRGHTRRTLLVAALRHQSNRLDLRSGNVDVVRRYRNYGNCRHRTLSGRPLGLRSRLHRWLFGALRLDFGDRFWRYRAMRLRRRGALRRSLALRPRADRHGVVRGRLPRAGFELSRTGRAGARRSLDLAQSILPARS